MSDYVIAVVDDDQHIRNLVEAYLIKENYRTIGLGTAEEAWELWRNDPPDMWVLDIMLPGMDGFELCRRIRQEAEVPIIMISAKDNEVDKILGLELGGDDYMVKPFSPREVVHRISGILYRTSTQGYRPHKPGHVSPIALPRIGMDPSTRKVTVDGARMELTVKEFELLYYLAANFGMPFSRQQLIRAVWKAAFQNDTRTVDTHVKRLREKMNGASPGSGDIIQTIRGFGYGIVD